jgi:hypothetical protein
VWQNRRGGIGGVGHRGVAQDHEHPVGRVADQSEGCPEDEPEGAFAADERSGHVEAVLGQQVLQRVARDLAGEPAEFGPDRRQLAADQVA